MWHSTLLFYYREQVFPVDQQLLCYMRFVFSAPLTDFVYRTDISVMLHLGVLMIFSGTFLRMVRLLQSYTIIEEEGIVEHAVI